MGPCPCRTINIKCRLIQSTQFGCRCLCSSGSNVIIYSFIDEICIRIYTTRIRTLQFIRMAELSAVHMQILHPIAIAIESNGDYVVTFQCIWFNLPQSLLFMRFDESHCYMHSDSRTRQRAPPLIFNGWYIHYIHSDCENERVEQSFHIVEMYIDIVWFKRFKLAYVPHVEHIWSKSIENPVVNAAAIVCGNWGKSPQLHTQKDRNCGR